jgi:hypothetical protein
MPNREAMTPPVTSKSSVRPTCPLPTVGEWSVCLATTCTGFPSLRAANDKPASRSETMRATTPLPTVVAKDLSNLPPGETALDPETGVEFTEA